MTNETSLLAEMKEEIIQDLKQGKNSKKGLHMSSAVVTVALAGLLIFSIVQTVQSATILNKIKSGSFKTDTSGGNSVLPSSLENLPNMVGGC